MLLTKYYYGDEINEDEMGGACSMPSGSLEMCTKYWFKGLKGRDHSQDQGVDGSTIINGS
jgi:hypothetical protein